MKEQFVTYEIALKLKELGFNEECLAAFSDDEYHDLLHLCENQTGGNFTIESFKYGTRAPLWQQAIDWFRVKYKINIEIIWLPNVSKYGIVVSDINYVPKLNDGNTNFIHGKDVTNNFVKFDMYEEAREQAILKAIELIKQSY